MHRLNISGQNIDISPALKTNIEEKIKKLVKHADSITNIHIVLSVHGHEYDAKNKAEGEIHLPGKQIHAEASSNDMYLAINQMIDKLDRQLIKFKETH